ncbi:MAG TPA: ATPase inhibitor subunit zeta [Caulobacteraceae bacterium]|jgi:hypothetical protein|nr:ATPase inhibitor subunit zeta [Caulobacteraceae bacterium]
MIGSDPERRDAERGRPGDDAFEVRVVALRNHMVSAWAAGLMGLSDPDAYAKAVTSTSHPAEEDVFRKISRDLADSGVAAAREVRVKMDEFLAQARMRLASADGG